VKKRTRFRGAGALEAGPNSVLSLLTDLVFISIAVYLIPDYVFALVFRLQSPLVVIREAFFIVYLLLTLVLLMIRNNAMAFTSKKMDYLYTILGFSLPLFFQPSLVGGPLAVGALLEVGGLALVASAIISLNRSFGLAPQNRGIKTGGVYRFVRHPMYLGYMLAEAGYVVDSFSPFNIFILGLSVLFLLLRLQSEEHLLELDKAYKSYSRKTRWKLLPLIF
jgi:protein-S-isoprenylcysteine O-methyltransferase Ste14